MKAPLWGPYNALSLIQYPEGGTPNVSASTSKSVCSVLGLAEIAAPLWLGVDSGAFGYGVLGLLVDGV